MVRPSINGGGQMKKHFDYQAFQMKCLELAALAPDLETIRSWRFGTTCLNPTGMTLDVFVEEETLMIAINPFEPKKEG